MDPTRPPPPFLPAGLRALYAACLSLYPEQGNPLQATARLKYWLGGPDPLDYVSMYSNAGGPGVPPHWHYVGFGLSDLHGDGRVHEPSGPDTPSGCGFELTFRLARVPGDGPVPPTWPATVMQALAKYVFQTENALCAGDHVSWHCPLDNSESRIQHMLMCEDPQLKTVSTPFGPVSFVQIVGVTSEELQSAQGWNGPEVVNLLRTVEEAGGPWLVTDMRRSRSLFDLSPGTRAAVEAGIAVDGSNLSGVSARCSWREAAASSAVDEELEREFAQISVQETEQIRATLKKGLVGSTGLASRVSPPPCWGPLPLTSIEGRAHDGGDQPHPHVRPLDRVHVRFDLEAGAILLMALKGRLRHGRHFTFKGGAGGAAVTLVPCSVEGAFVDTEHPFGAHGTWLQVLLQEEDVEQMLGDLTTAARLNELSLPKTFAWCEEKLLVTLMHEEY